MVDHERKLNRLAKWRSVFAGWQLGTRQKGDPECDAIRDHREVSLITRCEVNALTGLLIEKGLLTHEEFGIAIGKEADLMNGDLERRFPGMRATDDGIAFDARAAKTMEGWLP